MSTNVMALDAEGDEPGTMMDGQQAMPGGYGIRVELGVFDFTQNRERVVLFGICCVGASRGSGCGGRTGRTGRLLDRPKTKCIALLWEPEA